LSFLPRLGNRVCTVTILAQGARRESTSSQPR
jgi:hypothetical protein